MHSSLPQKLQYRQIYGGERWPGSSIPVKYFEKCPESLQIPLRKISDYNTFKNGHVFIGFSTDGKYLLSYKCKLSFQMDTEPVCYNYTLHFWLFDLWQPIKKVCEVQLFAHESIHYELHILICQPPNVEYIVVHGSTYSVDTQSNGKMTYVSIIPTDTTNPSIHLRYELLPPHPIFVTSISLKLPNVILLNSGDMLFAIMLNRYLTDDDSSVDTETFDAPQEHRCYCESLNQRLMQGSNNEFIGNKEYAAGRIINSSIDDYHENSTDEFISDNIFSIPKINQSCKTSPVVHVANKNISPKIREEKSFFAVSAEEVQNQTPDPSCIASSSINECSNIYMTDEENGDGHYECNKQFVSYVIQGFSLPTDEGSPESLPASPFDCTTQVLPCHLSSIDGEKVLKHAYEHRCFRKSDKGTKTDCDHFIGQAQFDAETFVNEEIQLCDDISRRFVSMRDYDMQIIDVCEERNEVIILINALVVFRDVVQRDDKTNTLSTQFTKSGLQRDNCYKLILYTLGYIVSWNVYSGRVTVLKRYPIVEGPGTICKSRQFAPSLSQTVQLRKGFFVPSAKNASVQTLSNHTVFSGKSLQYLFNPLLPVAVVM